MHSLALTDCISDGPLVLIMDDNPGDRELLIEAFAAHEQTLRIAAVESGDDGVEVLEDLMKFGRRPSLVMLDLNMPGMNGFSVLKYMAQRKFSEQTPVVVYTSSAQDQDRELCFGLGARLFCTKPADLDSLSSLARQLLKHVARIN